MEGYLHKKEGFFAGWVQYYFILHEDMLVYLDKKGGRPLGQIHMKIAKIQPSQKDKLLIQIFNGTNQIQLRAQSIKDMVQWTNQLINCQKQCLEGRYDYYKQKGGKSKSPAKQPSIAAGDEDEINPAGDQHHIRSSSLTYSSKQTKPDWHELLNMKFCSKIFTPDSPFFTKLSHIWELEAQLQELVSLIVPEATRTKNPLIKDYAEKISNVIEQMKEKMTDCFTDMEDTRREMYRTAKQMVRIKDGIINNKQQQLNVQSPNSTFRNTSKLTPQKEGRSVYQQYEGNQQQEKSGVVSSPMRQSQQISNIQRINSSSFDQKQGQENIDTNQKGGKKNLNAHLFDNISSISEGSDKMNQQQIVPSRQLAQGQNFIVGYGGIPITYTMKMREGLPALIPENQSYSIWAILKSAMGKDLSRITMPIWLNEPVSMLQKISEITHYHHLMDQAMTIKDDYRRMGHIGIFLMSQYSDVYQRTRKPFNPILGETYEIVQPNFRFMAEQVSHHPPISAFHLEGKGYYTHGDTDVKNFFWGSSLEFRAVGLQHLHLTDTNEHIIIKRPDNSANNLIVGKLYIDVHGKMEITNITKEIRVIINIHRIGWTKKNYYKVEGQVLDQDGKCRFEINGRWNEFLSLKDCSTGIEEELFRAEPKPAMTERMYGFGYYACNLNYLDEEMLKTLPPTDCRRRTDQRFMEQGKYDAAAEEKHRLEEKQRSVRKQREQMGIEYKPRYFQQVKDEFSGDNMYQFNHTYWEKRKDLDYGDLPDLF